VGGNGVFINNYAENVVIDRNTFTKTGDSAGIKYHLVNDVHHELQCVLLDPLKLHWAL
jgi:hypothetical protein